MILDNLSAHTGGNIRHWAKKHKVKLCFTPTCASWANPIEAHFGPLRQFTLANSNHRSHPAQTRALHAYPRWRNANARHPDVLAAQPKELPASAARRASAGAAPAPKQPDHPNRRTLTDNAARPVLLRLSHAAPCSVQIRPECAKATDANRYEPEQAVKKADRHTDEDPAK